MLQDGVIEDIREGVSQDCNNPVISPSKATVTFRDSEDEVTSSEPAFRDLGCFHGDRLLELGSKKRGGHNIRL